MNPMVKSLFWLVHVPTMSGNGHQPSPHFGSFSWLHLPSILIGKFLKFLHRCIQHHPTSSNQTSKKTHRRPCPCRQRASVLYASRSWCSGGSWLKHYRDVKMGDTMIDWLPDRENGDHLTEKRLMNLRNYPVLRQPIFGQTHKGHHLSTPKGTNHTGEPGSSLAITISTLGVILVDPRLELEYVPNNQTRSIPISSSS